MRSGIPSAEAPPSWLEARLIAAGGSVPFRTYMDWALHDPEHGAYGAGRLRIAPDGDFATSPSLGEDFGALLAPQIAAWLEELPPTAATPLALVETGPGEGTLALQLAQELTLHWPRLAERMELVLVEPNAGLEERQHHTLRSSPLPVRWSTFAALAEAPRQGVVLAHEVLDALPVERVEWDGRLWRRQRVALGPEGLALEPGEPLESHLLAELEAVGLGATPERLPPGWCTELHPEVTPWLRSCGAALAQGRLLVVDYALEARRYYAPARSQGTLMAYRGQRASGDPLRQPGNWDLTAHLCLESLRRSAGATGWRWVGERRQGEALLALGLARRLQELQRGEPGDLPRLLARREALLRLVDPAGLGDFRWILLQRGSADGGTDLFLQDPPR